MNTETITDHTIAIGEKAFQNLVIAVSSAFGPELEGHPAQAFRTIAGFLLDVNAVATVSVTAVSPAGDQTPFEYNPNDPDSIDDQLDGWLMAANGTIHIGLEIKDDDQAAIDLIESEDM
jgi:hypothetical protein